eukprot:8354651-Alexandrium_andersonii.AAC.1
MILVSSEIDQLVSGVTLRNDLAFQPHRVLQVVLRPRDKAPLCEEFVVPPRIPAIRVFGPMCQESEQAESDWA